MRRRVKLYSLARQKLQFSRPRGQVHLSRERKKNWTESRKIGEEGASNAMHGEAAAVAITRSRLDRFTTSHWCPIFKHPAWVLSRHHNGIVDVSRSSQSKNGHGTVPWLLEVWGLERRANCHWASLPAQVPRWMVPLHLRPILSTRACIWVSVLCLLP
jgi:hypothetical protein